MFGLYFRVKSFENNNFFQVYIYLKKNNLNIEIWFKVLKKKVLFVLLEK